MSKKNITKNEIYENIIGVDQVTKSNGVFTIRKGFFYSHGRSEQDLINDIKKVYPDAQVIGSGENWTPFNGGASVKDSTHWYVKFQL